MGNHHTCTLNRVDSVLRPKEDPTFSSEKS